MNIEDIVSLLVAIITFASTLIVKKVKHTGNVGVYLRDNPSAYYYDRSLTRAERKSKLKYWLLKYFKIAIICFTIFLLIGLAINFGIATQNKADLIYRWLDSRNDLAMRSLVLSMIISTLFFYSAFIFLFINKIPKSCIFGVMSLLAGVGFAIKSGLSIQNLIELFYQHKEKYEHAYYWEKDNYDKAAIMLLEKNVMMSFLGYFIATAFFVLLACVLYFWVRNIAQQKYENFE